MPTSNYNLTEEDEIVSEEEVYENYIIFDEEGNKLTEKRGVLLGDIIIDADFNKYEIVFVDDENCVATAKFLEQLEKPKIHKRVVEQIGDVELDKTIGMYSTHNDESYITGDGTESVYGAGGIHDIANLLAKNLRQKKVNVVYDETLHIPHDSSAYSRSRVTANALLKNGASTIFDIHRDGASRSFYLTENNGKNYSKIRIVIGQGNKNSDDNLQFALWMVSVADTMYPWLIADIYMGKGKYNQDLTSKALLFEMGCHKIEKEYVKNSVPLLSDVIYTTLYGTTVDEESGDLEIGTALVSSTEENTNPTVDEILEQPLNKSKTAIWWWLGGSFVALGVGYSVFYVIRKKKGVK